jgi:presequence protease
MSHGFVQVSEVELPEHRSVLRRYQHTATGLDVAALAADGEESSFGFVFRTPALDDTGVSHIVEHSVLCGSRRFPLKDPFVQLLKGSLSTYLNAWTFPDKTVYPGASTVEKDFFNLMKVYGDAVFFPRLVPEIFDQEAHRTEIDDKGNLRLVGVVYNEMRGVYSSPESAVGRWAHRTLFPDTTYGHDSGGDPVAVPSLTYEGFLAYHRRFYHPSNARVFIHGPVDAEKVLAFLQDELLARAERREPDSAVGAPAPWPEPRLVTHTFPVKGSDPTARRSSIVLNWRLDEAVDGLAVAAWEVLEELLLGNAGSPLRKALVESRLGEDLSPASGLDSELRWLVFTAGLRGTEPERRGAVEELVDGTLRRLAEGIPRESLDAALNRVEFRNREIRRSGGPPALELMRRSLRGWLHGASPEATLVFEKHIGEIRGRPRFFEDLIRQGLIENGHRATLMVTPEPGGIEREERELAGRLRAAAESMDERARAAVRERTSRLESFQQAPETPEALASLPRLDLADLPRQVDRVPRTTSTRGYPLHSHELFAGGVVYMDLVYPLAGVDTGLLPWLPQLSRAVTGLGLPGRSYDLVARDLALVTGGFSAYSDVGMRVDGSVGRYFFVRLKALRPNLGAAVDLARSLVASADLGDFARLADLVREGRNRMRASVIPGGSRYAALRASSRMRASAGLEEDLEGISQVLFQLGLDPDTGVEKVAAALGNLRAAVLRGPVAAGLTGEDLAEPAVLLRAFDGPSVSAAPPAPPTGPRAARDASRPGQESLLIPSPVGYVAQALDASPFGTEDNAHESVLAHLLSTGALWEAIRTRGGAYGAHASANGLDRLFTFSTYRDPNIVATLAAFRGALEGAAAGGVSEAETREAIIGCVGRDARPMAPGDKGLASLRRVLYGVSDELRQGRRDALFHVTAAGVAAAAARLRDALAGAATVVMSSREAVEAAVRQDGALAGLSASSTTIPV